MSKKIKNLSIIKIVATIITIVAFVIFLAIPSGLEMDTITFGQFFLWEGLTFTVGAVAFHYVTYSDHMIGVLRRKEESR